MVPGRRTARARCPLPGSWYVAGLPCSDTISAGVGGSTGDWNKASFEDLAGDAASAFRYLKTRADIDPKRIGLLGISQAGWVMPLAALREKDIAFLISISGPGVTGMGESLDCMPNELRMTRMPAGVI